MSIFSTRRFVLRQCSGLQRRSVAVATAVPALLELLVVVDLLLRYIFGRVVIAIDTAELRSDVDWLLAFKLRLADVFRLVSLKLARDEGPA